VKRALRIILIGVLALVVVAGLAWWWLTATAAGARFVLGQVESRVESLTYRDLDGALSPGLTLTGVRFGQAGLKVTADRLELAVKVRLMPLGLRVGRLGLDGVDVDLPPASGEPAPDEPFRPGDYAAPLPIAVDSLSIENLTLRRPGTPGFGVMLPQSEVRMLQRASEAVRIDIERIELSARYADALRLDSLSVRMPPYALTADGKLGLSDPWSSDLRAGLDWTLDENTAQRLHAELRGRLDDLTLTLDAVGPLSAEARAKVRGLPAIDALAGQVGVSGSLAGWPGLAARVDDLRLDASGTRNDWTAGLNGRLRWPALPEVNVSLAAGGSDEAVELRRGELTLLDGVVDVTGRAGLGERPGDPPEATAVVRLQGLDFKPMLPDWPAQAAVSGGFEAAWDGTTLSVRDLDLRAPPAPLAVTGSGSLDVPSRALDVALAWESLVWPPVTDGSEPLFSSESGRLEGSGRLEDWRAEIEAWLAAPGQPRARVELDAEGGADQARIRAGRVAFDGVGSIALTGLIGYTGPPSAELDLRLGRFDPGVFSARLPGAIDGDVGVRLDGLDPLTLAFEIRRLDGTLRRQPLSGSGALRVVDNRVERADLALSLGANRAELGTRDGTDWQIVVAAGQLAQLWPDLTGSLQIDATFDPTDSTAEWTLESPGMGWRGRRLAKLTSDGWVRWGEAPGVDARLAAADVDLNPWERLDEVRVALTGNCRSHTLEAFLSGTRATAEFELGGRLQGCVNETRGWSGAVQRLTLADTPLGRWQLAQDLPIQVHDGVVSAGAACLWTPAGTGRLCLNRLRAGARGEAAVAFNSVPIDLLLLPTDPVFTLGSRLRGVVDLGWDAGSVRELDAELRLGPGAAKMLGADEDLIVIRGARVSVESPRPRAIRSEFALRLESNSELRAEATIPDLSDPSRMRLDASGNLDLPNLGVLNRLVPQFDELSGALEGRFTVSGPVQSLDLNGRLAIRDGAFFHAPLGTRVTGLDLVLAGDERGGTLEGGFTAGAGRGSLTGSLDLSGPEGWQGRISLTGSDLTLFDVDWLEMTASPDLELGYFPERMEIDGRVRIDRARLGMPPGSAQQVSASPDVVVAGRGPEKSPDTAEPPARDIVGGVELVLGEDVRLVAGGLDTRVAGELAVTWKPGGVMPTARGGLGLVDGSYSAYGQNLEVTRGDVLFTGHPVDNPVLEIEAVRTIFGDPQVEQAGVRIQGPARDPEVSLFTLPPTSREKALAYILTGAEFDHAAGQGAFSVGFWVLPQLFVSYGLGLFDTGNVLAARYELSRRWGLRATSGERDTGVDVSFIIDR